MKTIKQTGQIHHRPDSKIKFSWQGARRYENGLDAFLIAYCRLGSGGFWILAPFTGPHGIATGQDFPRLAEGFHYGAPLSRPPITDPLDPSMATVGCSLLRPVRNSCCRFAIRWPSVRRLVCGIQMLRMTGVSQGLFRVIRVGLVICAACPIYTQHRTFPNPVGTSQLGHGTKSLPR
jgi:hypothetical protein